MFEVVRSRSESTGAVRCNVLVGVVRSPQELLGVAQSRLESSGVVRSRSRPEFSGVVWGRPESSRVVRSHLELSVLFQYCFVFRECFVLFCCLSLCACHSYTGRCFEGHRPLFRRPTSDDSKRLRLRTTTGDSGRYWITPYDSEELQIMLSQKR